MTGLGTHLATRTRREEEGEDLRAWPLESVDQLLTLGHLGAAIEAHEGQAEARGSEEVLEQVEHLERL